MPLGAGSQLVSLSLPGDSGACVSAFSERRAGQGVFIHGCFRFLCIVTYQGSVRPKNSYVFLSARLSKAGQFKKRKPYETQ